MIAIAPFIIIPIVIVLLISLTPSVIAAVLFLGNYTHIARCPFDAKTQVNCFRNSWSGRAARNATKESDHY